MTMWQRFRSWWFFHKRAVKAHIFGVGVSKRLLPKVGDRVYSCVDRGAFKTVTYVSALNDTIEYEDGTSDSIFHCGWSWNPPLYYKDSEEFHA